jgi:hypothetical protein
MKVTFRDEDDSYTTIDNLLSKEDIPERNQLSYDIALWVVQHQEANNPDNFNPTKVDLPELISKYKRYWLQFHNSEESQFPIAFHYVVAHCSQPIYDNMISIEKGYASQQRNLQNQYREALLQLKQSHKQIMEHIGADDKPLMKQQQQKEAIHIHTKWHSKIDSLCSEQQKEYQAKIIDIYHSLLHPGPLEVTEPMPPAVESIDKGSSTVRENEDSAANPSQKLEIQSMIDMGFTKEDAKIALEISKNNVERAIMILLETPNLIQEHVQRSVNLPRKKVPKDTYGLRKSNSMTFVGESSNEPKSIPQLDWSQKRSFSSPKLPQEIASPKSSKKPQRVLSTSPFGKVGNFLGKAMDVFRLEEDILQKDDDEEELLSDTFTVYCGSQQQKTMYNLQLQVVDMQKLLVISNEPSQTMAIKASTHQSLYSNSLSAMVVLVKDSDLQKYPNGTKVNKCNTVLISFV